MMCLPLFDDGDAGEVVDMADAVVVGRARVWRIRQGRRRVAVAVNSEFWIFFWIFFSLYHSV
jgi:hypothetical protein